MTHEALIGKAREHAAVFERGESFAAKVSEFPNVAVRETVVVYFRSHERDDQIEIYLDKESGDFIGATYSPPTGAH
jgi:hypothetical protein